MEDRERETQLSFLSSKTTPNKHITLEDKVELKGFANFIKWTCVDQSNPFKTTISWSVFFLFGIGVPILSHFVLKCSICDEDHRQPFDSIVQLSLSSLFVVSFVCLTNYIKRYGLRRFLFLDKLCDQSHQVRHGYALQLQKSMKMLYLFMLPIFVADCAYKIWWYITGGVKIPHLGNIIISHSIAFILDQCSWLYRTSIFFLVCVLYRASCYLQILKLEDFALVFQIQIDVASVLSQHLRIRKTLRIISHRFRAFIMCTLLLVTASQLASLLVTTKSNSDVDIYTAGELALCSVTLVTGVCICLGSAAKITHKAQSITALASKWHLCATIDSFDGTDGETPTIRSNPSRNHLFNYSFNGGNCDSDEEEGDGEDELDNTKMMPTFVNTISYQKRQALVTYLENNRAGITVFGFMLDRTYLHTIFGVELSLVLWLLSKTVGIS